MSKERTKRKIISGKERERERERERESCYGEESLL